MKAVATLLLFLSLHGAGIAPPQRPPRDNPRVFATHKKRGRWYMAESGHAVYCSGPVKMVSLEQGRLMRVATGCQGERPLVPLRD